MMNFRTALFLIFIVTACTGIAQPVDVPMQQGHEYVQLFYSGSLKDFHSKIVDKSFTFSALTEFKKKVHAQLGHEVELLNERITEGRHELSFYKYTRYSRFDKAQEPVRTVFVFDEKDRIYEFSIESLQPVLPSRFENYKTKTNLHLPFEGQWLVVWGGRTMNLNNHAASPDQRFAYDFTVMKNRSQYSGDGSKNEQYFAYMKTILAPGSGIIVKVVNTVPENKPGEMTSSPGNYVVIDHENGEYSFLCHLYCGSIDVKEGQRVKQGQKIGLCGNSGYSTAPGLHYHLQNTPRLYDGEGLPAQFNDYFADSVFINRGEPQWNQNVWLHE